MRITSGGADPHPDYVQGGAKGHPDCVGRDILPYFAPNFTKKFVPRLRFCPDQLITPIAFSPRLY